MNKRIKFGNPDRTEYIKNKEKIDAEIAAIPKEPKTGKKCKSAQYKHQQMSGLLDKLNNK